MGGAITLRAHLLHGCEFARYVLLNVVAMRPWGSAFFDHVGRHVEAFMGLPPHIHRAVVEAYIKGALVNDLEPGDFEELVLPWLSEEGRVSFYRQFAQADEKYTQRSSRCSEPFAVRPRLSGASVIRGFLCNGREPFMRWSLTLSSRHCRKLAICLSLKLRNSCWNS